MVFTVVLVVKSSKPLQRTRKPPKLLRDNLIFFWGGLFLDLKLVLVVCRGF